MTREGIPLPSAIRIARTTVRPPRAPAARYLTAPVRVRTPRDPVSIHGAGFADAAVGVSATPSAAATKIAVRIGLLSARVSASARETSRPRHGERSRVDGTEAGATTAPYEHEAPPLEAQLHAEPAPDLPREVDAARLAV